VERGRCYLCTVEPEAAKALEDLGLQEAHPAGMQLHDDCERGVGGEDDVVDHAGVVAYPDMICAGHRAGSMVPNHPRPAGHECLALELHQDSLPSGSLVQILEVGHAHSKGRKGSGWGIALELHINAVPLSLLVQQCTT
jgi:hypothetical protein